MIHIGLDRGHATVREADHWLRDLVRRLGLPAECVACTHLVQAPYPHVAASLATPAPIDAATLPRTADELAGGPAGPWSTPGWPPRPVC